MRKVKSERKRAGPRAQILLPASVWEGSFLNIRRVEYNNTKFVLPL